MQSRLWQYAAIVPAFALVTLGSCKGRQDSDTASRTMESPADTAQAPTAAGGLTDANIVALLDEANEADSAAGAVGTRQGHKFRGESLRETDDG